MSNHEKTNFSISYRMGPPEKTLGRDILLMTRVDKPALLRRLFSLACQYSGQILSFQKMLGQLSDKGNTTTLAHYLSLLDGAGLVTGLEKYSGEQIRQRASSPKLLPYNTALMTAMLPTHFDEARNNPTQWGRWVEAAIGMHIVNEVVGKHKATAGLHAFKQRYPKTDVLIIGESGIPVQTFLETPLLNWFQ